MGRGRAKAKQVKVARQLKYSGGGMDLDRLRAEFGVGTDQHESGDHSAYTDFADRYSVDDDEDDDPDEDDLDDDLDLADDDLAEDNFSDDDFDDEDDEFADEDGLDEDDDPADGYRVAEDRSASSRMSRASGA
jgi:Protein of unknown function (DUF3073)